MQNLKTHPQKSRIDINKLRTYPVGTFGKAWADSLDYNNLEPLPIPSRRAQLHDGLHVLLGYGIDAIDEARVQAFLLGTKNRFKAVNVGILGLLMIRVMRELYQSGNNNPTSRQIIFKALEESYQRGYNCTLNPDNWQPESLWHLSLEEVRAKFNL